MPNTEMRRLNSISQDEIDRWITPPRFQAFLEAADHDVAQATALYDWNICVSAVFFETISYTEVLLRNAIDAQFMPVQHHQPASESWLCDPEILTTRSLEKVFSAVSGIRLHRAFPHGTGSRKEVAGLMARLNPFRNRLAHHEPIINASIPQRHDDLVELARLIDEDAAEWIAARSSVMQIVSWRPPLSKSQRLQARMGLTPRTVRFHLHR